MSTAIHVNRIRKSAFWNLDIRSFFRTTYDRLLDNDFTASTNTAAILCFCIYIRFACSFSRYKT